MCAETEEEALRIAASRNLGRLYSVTNRAKGIPTVEEALNYPYQMNELAFIRQYSQVCVDGDPATGEGKAGKDCGSLPDRRFERGNHLPRLRRPGAVV